MKTFFVTSLLCFFSVAVAQKYDHNWIHIYPSQDTTGNSPLDPPYPSEFLTFDASPPTINYFNGPLPGFRCEMILNDYEGNPLLYSNGYKIYHIDGSIMANGDSLLTIILEPGFRLGAYNPLSMMAIPRPGHTGDYYILHQYYELNWTYIPKLLLSLVSGATAPDKGIVAFKNKVLFEGHNVIDYFDITKHANGRDWWLVFSDIDVEASTRTFYSYCITADTIYQAQTQTFVEYEPVPDHPALIYTFDKLFSPNGFFYINHDAFNGTMIHSFDRCTGELSHPVNLPFHVGLQGGSGYPAVSPNSQFLYTANGDYIFQYDLTAQDIEATKDTVGVYDGYLDPPAGIPTLFGYPKLGPDGKIYYFITGQDWVHIIAEPNKKGAACHFIQRAFRMPVRAGAYPFYPNYRLGPLDGSSCDTLGINNEPLADFWWFSDSTLQVRFSDNSFYEPSLWQWNFGDGGISQDTSPVHVFPASGTYHVCLTVSKQFAANTVCKDVTVGGMVPVVTPAFEDKITVSISPNPAKNSIQVQLTGVLSGESQLQIFDVLGKLQYTTPIQKDKPGIEISTLAFSNGIYYCRLTKDGKVLSSSKFIVQH